MDNSQKRNDQQRQALELASVPDSRWLFKIPFINQYDNIPMLTKMIAEKNPCDFNWAISFDPDFLGALMYEGFLTTSDKMPDGQYVLMPKLHASRCLLHLDSFKVSSSILKKAKKYFLSFDKAMDQVCDEVVAQHGENWFHKPLVQVFKAMNRRGKSGNFHGKVFLHSVELWCKENDEMKLVAGEVGYAFGSIYVSLSGFRKPEWNSAGTVQMIALGCFLKTHGYTLWDLGMEIEYKLDLGAVTEPRSEFMETLRAARDASQIPFLELEITNARTLILPIQQLAATPPPPPIANPLSKTQLKKQRKREKQSQNKKLKASNDTADDTLKAKNAQK